MERTINTPNYGTVTVRNAMFDIDGTTLEEGIEIKGENIELIEVCGYRDITDMDIDEIEQLIEDYQ
jgi:hypothetical protein